MGNGFAVDQQDALVAGGDLGDESLRHDLAPAVARQGFDDHRDIGIVGPRAEHIGPAHAVEGFVDHVPMFFVKRPQQRLVRGNEERRAALRKQRGGHLFVAEPVVGIVAHGQFPDPGPAATVAEIEIGLEHVLNAPAAGLGCEEHGQGGVLFHGDGLDGVHHDSEFDCHTR